MPLIQPASVLVSDQAGISVGMSAATLKAPICAHACAAHIAITPRCTVMRSSSSALHHPRRDLGKIGRQPSEEHGGCGGAEHLCHYEARHVGGTNAGEGVAGRAR